MSKTSMPDRTQEGYVFSPDADMSLVAQNFAFTRIVPKSDLGDITEDTLIEDADNLDHRGKPLRYYVDHFISADETVLLDRLNPLPCSVDWCLGHVHHEAETWEDLTHTACDIPLLHVEGFQRNEGSVSLIEKAGVQKLSLFLNIEGDVDREQARDLALQLQHAAEILLERGAALSTTVDA